MCDEGSRGLEAFSFEGTRARSRNKDDKNVPDATTAFKTVACLNVTLAHAKIGCAVLVVGSCADCRRGVSLERLPDAALDPAILSEQS